MTFFDFLQRCHDSAIRFSLLGEELKVSAPKDTLSPEVVAQLRQFKPELIASLRENDAAGRAVVDAFPLTPNGKIDKRALPAPDASALAVAYVAPRTQAEVALAGIWAALLKVDQVGTADNVFSLGGHSLLAVRLLAVRLLTVRLLAEMRKQLGVELSVKDIFSATTLAALAQLADASSASARSPITARTLEQPSANLVRPAAPVVHRPVRRRQRSLQHAGRAARTITRTITGQALAPTSVVQAQFSRFYETEPDPNDPPLIFAYCHGPSIVIRRIDPLNP